MRSIRQLVHTHDVSRHEASLLGCEEDDHVCHLLGLPDITAKIEREVMVTLRDLAGYQMPKKVLIIEEDFTEENGALTPSLKVKRHVVEERYRDRIEACYE